MGKDKFNYSQLTAGKYKLSGLSLLTTNSLKTIKGLDHGILSGILYLAPHTTAGAKDPDSGERINVCSGASPACMKACLYRSGASLIYRNINEARIRKTKLLFSDRDRFLSELAGDIAKIERAGERRNLIPAIRLNGTSDLAWERIPIEINGKRYRSIMQAFPAVSFYDYTKREDRISDLRKLPRNYTLVFSRSEINDRACKLALRKGINVAIVFYKKLPASYWSFPVINGDLFDARFMDPSPAIVGLKAKAHAKKDRSSFVIRDHIEAESGELAPAFA